MMNPLPLVLATLKRNPVTSLLFLVLISVAVGLGVAITAQERALRQGSARAADRFDLIVAAPGSQTDVLLKVVYLASGSVELVKPDLVSRAMAEPRTEFVAPIAFGDSHDGAPVIGTIAAFALHMSGGSLADGRMFRDHDEAVVGAASALEIGERFRPTHGDGHAVVDEDDHREHGTELTVVGRLAATGSPWDRAIVVPVELVWDLHNLPTGHAAGNDRIGPPFDAAALPGIPALVIKPDSLAAAYGLRNTYRGETSMAFFPAEVLVELYTLLGNVRSILDMMAIATQTLVIVSILVGIMVLLRTHRRQFAVLRALGAPRRYVLLTVWSYVAVIVVAGAIGGLALGHGLTGAVSAVFSATSGIALDARLGLPEFALAAAVVLIGAVMATVPAVLMYARAAVHDLR